MKKLISLLAVVAILVSSTVCVFADTTITLPEELTLLEANNENIYEVNVEGLTSAYATILAVKGTTIKVGAIQYINQDATNGGAATFNFALNNDLLNNETSSLITDDVYVLTGGDGNVNVAGYIDVTHEEDDRTAFTVSGTVTNFVEQTFVDDLNAAIEELYGADKVAEYEAAYLTNACLIELDEIENFLNYYVGDADSFSSVASCAVSGTDGTYSFSNIENGDYALVITRPSALPYMEYLTVDGEDVVHKSVSLIMGDVTGYVDTLIDSEDLLAILKNGSALGEDDDFMPSYDVVPDYLVDSEDLVTVLKNSGDISVYNTDLLNDLLG